jgi:uncharacterized membrane protein
MKRKIIFILKKKGFLRKTNFIRLFMARFPNPKNSIRVAFLFRKNLMRKITVHTLFLAGILVKGIDGFLELVGGIILLFVRSTPAVDLVKTIFSHELAQDPTDAIANFLLHLSQNISASALSFTALYLIVHGVIKIGLFIGLWRKVAWMYPLGGVVLFFFVLS